MYLESYTDEYFYEVAKWCEGLARQQEVFGLRSRMLLQPDPHQRGIHTQQHIQRKTKEWAAKEGFHTLALIISVTQVRSPRR